MDLIEMPFLAHARTPALFLKRVARLYSPATAEYSRLDRIVKATDELFANEQRYNGDPFVTHSLSVPLIAMELVCVRKPAVLLAGVAHDNREYVQELIEKGTCPREFLFWNDPSAVEEQFGYDTEALLAGVTAPRVHDGRSSKEAHALYYERFVVKKDWRELFEVKLPDRLHNQRTLSRKMKLRKIRNKNKETKRHYMFYARYHDILVKELTNAVEWGEGLAKEPQGA